jgi:Family of unknown function (DUF5677)
LGDLEIPIEPKGSVNPKVVAATLLIRTTSNFKGAIALARLGMIVETRTLTRCCVENLFWLAKLEAEGDSFLKEVGFDEVRSSQKRAQFILDKSIAVEEATQTRLRETFAKLSKAWPEAKLLNPKGVAKGSQIESFYLLYRQLSADAAHPSLTALFRYLLREEETGKRGIDVRPVPRSGEMASTVHVACITLIGACAAFDEIVGTVSGRAIKGFLDKFLALEQATGVT